MLGAIFAQIFRDFAQIFNKSKVLGVRLHPRLLHHCYLTSQRSGLFTLMQCFSKWRNRNLGGDFDGQRGEKSKGGDRWAKKHQRGENAKSLLDD